MIPVNGNPTAPVIDTNRSGLEVRITRNLAPDDTRQTLEWSKELPTWNRRGVTLLSPPQ